MLFRSEDPRTNHDVLDGDLVQEGERLIKDRTAVRERPADAAREGHETPNAVTLPCEDEALAFLPHLSEASGRILDCFGAHQDVEWAWNSLIAPISPYYGVSIASLIGVC